MKAILKMVFTFVIMPLLVCSQKPDNQESKENNSNEEKEGKAERVFHEARFDWGITAGASYGLIEIGNLGRLRNEVITSNNMLGYQAGFFIQPQSDMFYVKPTLLYSSSKGETGGARPTTIKIHKIELPMLFGIRFYKQWCVEGGPVLSHAFSITDQFPRFGEVSVGKNGLGYNAGIAYDNNLFIIKATIQGITYEDPGLKQSLRERNQLVLSAAYKFTGVQRMSFGDKKFHKVYLPKGKKKIRINYFRK
jgi:hypothetical protein